jgi:imidazolonepropionase-like amidohydrolase
LKVVVDKAYRQGKPVAAHAIGNEATRISAQARINLIEHVHTVPADVLKMIADKKIFSVPTDCPANFYLAAFQVRASATPAQRQSYDKGARTFNASNNQRLARALKAGVRIAAGSDEYYQLPGKTRGQASLQMFHAYAAASMRPLDII